MTTKIGNTGIEALAGPARLKARIQRVITGLDRQISLGRRINADGIIHHAEYIPVSGQEPNYDAALAALKELI